MDATSRTANDPEVPVDGRRTRDGGAGRHATIGESVVIKGELSGSEDCQIDGTVDGTIDLHEHVLTIGIQAKITAQIRARAVIVLGRVTGNITAQERIELREDGSIEGDIVAPRVAMAEGAHFRGSIDMQAAKATSKTRDAKPAGPAPSNRTPSAPQKAVAK